MKMKCTLKRYREIIGMTQEELAEKIGIAMAGTVGVWERGVRLPRVDIAVKCAKVLGVPVEILWEVEEA